MSERIMHVWDKYILPLVQQHGFNPSARHGIERNGKAIAWAMQFPSDEEEYLTIYYWSVWNDNATCVMFCYSRHETRGSSWEIRGCQDPQFPLGPSESQDVFKYIERAFELVSHI